MMMIFLEGPARAQSGTEPLVTIPVHRGISTTLFLPDEVEHIRLTASVAGLMAATTYENKVFIRPLRDAPVGEEVTLAVRTATIKQRFRLRVVRHVRDAAERVVVAPAAQAAPAAEPAAPAPAKPAGTAAAVPAPPVVDVQGERDAAATRAPRFDVSVHAVAALGTTALAVPGYDSVNVRQTHHALGARLTAAPRGAWWAVAVDVSGERLAGPTLHARGDVMQRDVIEMSGLLLRAEAGVSARFGTPWSPTADARIGLRVHHRNIEGSTENVTDDPDTQRDEPTRDMPFGGMLALGVGLQYRARNMLLGLELQVRQGVPADYRSVTAVVSVGCFLNQAE